MGTVLRVNFALCNLPGSSAGTALLPAGKTMLVVMAATPAAPMTAENAVPTASSVRLVLSWPVVMLALKPITGRSVGRAVVVGDGVGDGVGDDVGDGVGDDVGVGGAVTHVLVA